ncbi:MAG: lipid-A-disaccharide synthase, partial [Bosea sp. (in: a-proteobacteria)]
WEAAVARRLVKLPSVILPNLILGQSVVPEFIQQMATPQALADALLDALREGEARQRQLAGFAQVEAIMRSAGANPAANAVDAALALVGTGS